jgi:putative endonuclease
VGGVIARSEATKQSRGHKGRAGLLRLARNDEVVETLMKAPCVYIMASHRNGTIYTGVSSDLLKRVHLHRSGILKGFTKKYGCKLLVWFEMHATMPDAIRREKQIKAGGRLKKLELIERQNPGWNDLYESLT